MTETELRNAVATWLDPYKGLTEGDSKHKEIINIFNNSGLCTRYKMTVSDAWCATAVSAAFIATGLTDIFPCVECSCGEMINLAKAAGIWVEDDSYIPSVGDVVLYDWQDSGSGDNTGYPDHVGIVQTVNLTTFTVIEGNKSDTVGTRDMAIDGQYIRGFIAPNYAAAATGETAGSVIVGNNATTSSGTTISAVAALTVDGQIGTKTVKALQTRMGTTVDGTIDGQPSNGKQYWTSILASVCRWSGGASQVVKALQTYVIGKGYSCGSTGADGKLGKNTAKGVQNFLIGKGFSCGSAGADGYFGTNSAKALQSWLNDN